MRVLDANRIITTHIDFKLSCYIEECYNGYFCMYNFELFNKIWTQKIKNCKIVIIERLYI